MLENEVLLNIACLRASRCVKLDAGAVKCGIGNSDVTSDMYPEPMKSILDLMLIEDVEHTCSHPQPPSVGGHTGQGGCHEVYSQGGGGVIWKSLKLLIVSCR